MKIKLHEDPSNVEVGEFCGDYFATPRCRRVFGISDFHENREHGTESRSRIPMVETSGINCTKAIPYRYGKIRVLGFSFPKTRIVFTL